MSNYTKTTDFEAKDSLPTGDAEKIIRGADFETEFDNIATAIATKADTAGPTFTGTVTIPTAAVTTLSLGGTTVTSTAAEVNLLDGVTATTAELNLLDGVTATTAELNILDGVTATAAELNTLDGITSTTAELNTLDGFTGTYEDLNFAQTLRASGVTGDEFDILDGLTATAVELNILDGATVTTAELNLLDGVTATTAELNILDGVTSTAAELNILDGVTSTAAELNLVDGSTAGTVVNSKAVVYGATGEVNATTLQVGGVAITSTPAELNLLDGATVTTAEINILDGVTATATELNTLDGITSTTAELNILDGVTATATELNTMDGITATTAELNILDGVTADATELNKLDGVTATTSELNYVDVTTLGVVEASKAVTADANADVLFGDNDKAIFGAGSDLKIYHDGSDSYIDDTGTGRLRLRGAADIVLAHPTNGETYATFSANGANTFYYDDSAKLATTSTGIDVTGTVTADDVLVGTGTTTKAALGSAVTQIDISNAVGFGPELFIHNSGQGGDAKSVLTFGGKLSGYEGYTASLHTTNNDGLFIGTKDASDGVADQYTLPTTRININADGDISFYEDTGTTAKLFWDASAESLGIGTSSPAGKATVKVGDADGNVTTWNSNYFLVSSGDSTISQALGMGVNTANDYAFLSSLQPGTAWKTLKYKALDHVFEGANDTERMRIDSSGDMIMKGGRIKVRENDDGNDAVVITRDADEGYVNLYSSGTQTVEIRGNGNSYFNGGNVGIGTDSPEAALTVTPESGNFNGTYNSYDGVGLFIRGNGTAGSGNYGPALVFGSADSDGANQENKHSAISMVQTGNDANQAGLAFWIHKTDASTANLEEAMRIDSSGNLLVGTTDTDPANNSTNSTADDGVAITNVGEVRSSRYLATENSGAVGFFNRTGTDGDIVRLRKSGTTVGSIGTSGGDLTVGTGDTGLTFEDSADVIHPINQSTGAARDNAIDLGKSAARFKDLHLSGGAYLGGTGSANKLDDYEEGTWTPTLGGTWTTNPTNLSGTYTKIGRVVYITVQMTGGAKSSSVSGYIEGVPIGISSGTGSVSDSAVSDRGNCLFQNGDRIWLTNTSFGTGTVYITGTYLAA